MTNDKNTKAHPATGQIVGFPYYDWCIQTSLGNVIIKNARIEHGDNDIVRAYVKVDANETIAGRWTDSIGYYRIDLAVESESRIRGFGSKYDANVPPQ